MKNLILAIIIIFSYGALQAQNIIKPEYNNDGFYLGASLLGSIWTVENSHIDAEAGGGLGLKLGYNFNTKWGLFAAFDAALIEPEQGDDYLLGQLDLGVQYTFKSTSDRIRPYARASFIGLSAQDDDTELNGGGISLGAGALIFLTKNLAFDTSYAHAWVDLTEAVEGSSTFEIDERAQTGRLLIGLTYHF